jgi:hypothetical protein
MPRNLKRFFAKGDLHLSENLSSVSDCPARIALTLACPIDFVYFAKAFQYSGASSSPRRGPLVVSCGLMVFERGCARFCAASLQ